MSALLTLLFATSLATAAEPITLTHQGRLVDALGTPVSAPVEITLELYASASGGTAFHDESFALTPSGGYYSVVLGKDPADPLLDTELPDALFLQVLVDSVEIGGRVPLTHTPMAAVAASSTVTIVDTASGRQWSDGTVANSCLDYRHPTGGRAYAGETGDGVYQIDAGGQTPFSVVCDMTRDGGGWTLLMKAAGTTFGYDSAYWTNTATLNPSDLDTNHGEVAKYASFNDVPVSELMITAQNGGRTQLGLPTTQTARALFNASGQVLFVTGGARTPAELINGRDYAYCGAAWRTNSYVSGTGIRLGGYVYSYWDCDYGIDATGTETGAHLLGFGTRDTRWGPYTGAVKSFGVRDAHDNTHIPPGQAPQSAHLWGR